jgi:hypothetical protein
MIQDLKSSDILRSNFKESISTRVEAACYELLLYLLFSFLWYFRRLCMS